MASMPSMPLPANRKDLEAYLARLDISIQMTEARLADYERDYGTRAKRPSGTGDPEASAEVGQLAGEREMLQRLRTHRDEVLARLREVRG